MGKKAAKPAPPIVRTVVGAGGAPRQGPRTLAPPATGKAQVRGPPRTPPPQIGGKVRGGGGGMGTNPHTFFLYDDPQRIPSILCQAISKFLM